ncbi:uncharacterized protein LOC130923865 [Corythoichthys intestinalis]|uniref:uncharacterized protein LOC130923865 n=1 Tax=Corythoichthys intestinalis TaxID=161448 RepID=UPI0025A68668|nr:uncharacterized protein LOC130923865 [Corythoichthys intestinalis]
MFPLVLMAAACATFLSSSASATFLTSSASVVSYPRSPVCVGDGWERILDRCFSFSDVVLTFDQLEGYCRKRNGLPAVLSCSLVYYAVTDRIGHFPGNPEFWVGLFRQAYRVWFSWDYNINAFDYGPVGFFPKSKESKMTLWKDCLTLNGRGFYNGYDCSSRKRFICEANNGPVCPTCNCPACPSCPVCALREPCPPTPAPCGTPPPSTLPCGTLPPAPTCRAPLPCALHPGPGNVTLWHETSILTRTAEDIRDSCMLVMSPNEARFLVRLLSFFGVGRSIVIRGQVQPEADRVIFQLRMANGTALNLGFRVNGREIVLDSKLGNSWDVEQETEADSLPIEPGLNFEVIIQCYVDRFRVTVDGVHQEDFKYQGLNPQIFTALTARRDVSLADVKLI